MQAQTRCSGRALTPALLLFRGTRAASAVNCLTRDDWDDNVGISCFNRTTNPYLALLRVLPVPP